MQLLLQGLCFKHCSDLLSACGLLQDKDAMKDEDELDAEVVTAVGQATLKVPADFVMEVRSLCWTIVSYCIHRLLLREWQACCDVFVSCWGLNLLSWRWQLPQAEKWIAVEV